VIGNIYFTCIKDTCFAVVRTINLNSCCFFRGSVTATVYESFGCTIAGCGAEFTAIWVILYVPIHISLEQRGLQTSSIGWY